MPSKSPQANEIECIRCGAITTLSMRTCPKCDLSFFPIGEQAEDDGRGPSSGESEKVNGLVSTMLANGRDWMDRLDAAEALAKLHDPRGIGYLNMSLRSDNPEIREVAREILTGLGDGISPLSTGDIDSEEEYAPSPYSKSKYTALRGIASLCTGLGWLIVGLAGFAAIGSLLVTVNSDDLLVGIAGVVASVVIGGFSFMILRIIAESISVLLDIEANTRQAAISTRETVSILKQRPK